MADISKIIDIGGTTYDIKDTYARQSHDPIALQTKTYTDVIATANDNNGAGFFYLKYRGTTYDEKWHIKVRVHATVPGQHMYDTETTFDLWGFQNTYSWYACLNRIKSTSYRPIYYNCHFRVSSAGYTNGCGGWIGFNLISATNNLNTSYKRTIVVELLEYTGCTVELQDQLITPTNIPDRAAHTNWYSSTNTSFDNFDACNYGLKQSGDANTTSISNLYLYNGNYIANSAIYRYQTLFTIDENTLTPLNNNDNVVGTTKTMLTDIEFNAFGPIYYYYTTTVLAAQAAIASTTLYYSMSGYDLRYTFNCDTTLTAHKPLYLTVTPTSNGKCKISSVTPWAQELPTTNDGKWYILLGRTYSTYQAALYRDHPVYMHDGTSLHEVLPQTATATSSTSGLITSTEKTKLSNAVVGPSSSTANHVATFSDATGKTVKDSGFTIGKSVPSDAVFTDTTYTFDGTYNASTNKAATVSTVTNAVSGKVSINQGAGNAGKFLVVNSSGNVEPVSMTAWQGGSY